ncbi:MAG TPA: hypothetical protein PLJ21_12385, partial [Pseudobdellovibrionaceae bacterium]|nr:hypothetical protein [Pseudobdellovibrionaceae bacterium]
MKTQKTITLKTIQGVLLITTLMLSACAKRSSYESSSSRVDTQNSDKAYAICSQGKDIKTSTGFTITLETNGDPLKGEYTPDWTVLSMKQVPETFKTENQYIQFWRWKASSVSDVHLDKSAPLGFYLMRVDTNQYLPNYLDKLTWKELQEILVANNMPASSLSEAIDQVRFMVNNRDKELN